MRLVFLLFYVISSCMIITLPILPIASNRSFYNVTIVTHNDTPRKTASIRITSDCLSLRLHLHTTTGVLYLKNIIPNKAWGNIGNEMRFMCNPSAKIMIDALEETRND